MPHTLHKRHNSNERDITKRSMIEVTGEKLLNNPVGVTNCTGTEFLNASKINALNKVDERVLKKVLTVFENGKTVLFLLSFNLKHYI